MTAYVPPYGPSIQEWMRQVSNAINNNTLVNGTAILSGNGASNGNVAIASVDSNNVVHVGDALASSGLQFETPYTMVEVTAASVATPASGKQILFIDTADHKLKRKDSSGTVTIIA